MMNTNFVFYDLETTGLSAEYDQILQFAAVCTNQDFEILESVNLRCKLLDHVVPSFMALVTTGLSIDELFTANLTEYELALEINKLFRKWSPCIFVGYNSINFDEKFIRHLFYRNLLPVYQTQSHGNGRLDILKAVKGLELHDPNAIKIGVKSSGKPDRRLECLAPLNGFGDHNAHDALGDVNATIHIAQKIQKSAPDFWKNYVRCNTKMSTQSLFSKSAVVETVIGTELVKFIPVQLNPDRRSYICADATDLVAFSDYLNDNLAADDLLKSIKFRTFALNQSDYVATSIDNDAKITSLVEKLTASPVWEEIRNSFVTEFAQPDPSCPIEERIYGGFPSDHDDQIMYSFHRADPDHKFVLLKEFEDEKYMRFAMRIMAQNFCFELSQKSLFRYSEWVSARISNDIQGTSPSKELETLNKWVYENGHEITEFKDFEAFYFEKLSK